MCFLERSVLGSAGDKGMNLLNEGTWLREKVTWLMDQKKWTKKNGLGGFSILPRACIA